jgi:sugar lactone lactonase YvrE
MMPSRHLALACAIVCTSSAFAGGGRDRVAGDELPLPRIPGPVVIDGDLREWDAAQAKDLALDLNGSEDAVLEKHAFAGRSARIALRHDDEALYVAVWWRTPNPLELTGDAGRVPPGDGLVLHLPVNGMTHLALWRSADGPRVALSTGTDPLARGTAVQGIAQGFTVTGKEAYTQEVRIPWSVLGGRLPEGQVQRIGVELGFAGLDPAAGYQAALREFAQTGEYKGNRWGGNMCWGFVDGLATLDMPQPSMNPQQGAEVVLMPAGASAGPNPVVMHLGHEQTRTTRMIAVPAGAIQVDGVLAAGEWDPASATTVASEPTLMPGRYSVDVHWAYAKAGLYLGLRWHTAGPHLNINDPRRISHGYDGGDALQVRLATDRVTHLDAWFHGQSRTGCLGLAYGTRFDEGKVANALQQGAQMALRDTPGGGYTQEILLPWTLITKDGTPLVEGGRFRAILDVFFSGLEGNLIPFILNVRPQERGGLPIALVPPRDGYYSAVIEDPDSRQIVRRLWNHVQSAAGQALPAWDGLTEDGAVAPAKTYQVRGLHHTGIGTRYLSTLNNPGSPPWQTDDGAGDWGGDHGNPHAVAADARGIVLAWPGAEDGYGVIGCNAEGRKQWGQFGTGDGDSAAAMVAVAGDQVFVAREKHLDPPRGTPGLGTFRTVVSCLDRATGRRSGFSVAKPFATIATAEGSAYRISWWWDLWQSKDLTLDTRSINDDYYYSGHCIGGNLTGLAAAQGRLYVAFRRDNQIKVYDSATMDELAAWPIAAPGGLCTAPDGALYAVSGIQVVRLDPASGAATPIVRSGLQAPVALAVAGDGTLYISEWGTAQCVRVFAKDGSPLRTIGTPGGRAWVGAFDPAGMLMPRGLALDAQQRLWVAEDDGQPRRISVWDAVSGRLVRDFIGGTAYGGVNGGQIAPWDAGRALSAGMWFGIDLGKEGYRPLLTIDRRRSLAACFSFDQAANATPTKRFLRVGDRRFLAAGQFHSVLGELQGDGTWKPLCAFGRSWGASKMNLWRDWTWPSFFDQHPKDAYIWIDRNRDGACQEDEMQWRTADATIGDWCLGWSTGGFDAGFNAYVGNGKAILKIPFGGWDADGLPRYDIAQAAVVAQIPAGRFHAIAVDAGSGQLFTVIEANSRRWKNQDPGLYSFHPDGSPWWRILVSEDVRPMGNLNGEAIMGPVEAGGDIGGMLSTTQWHGLHVPLLTTDGIYIGRVLRDPAQGGDPGPDMFRGECVQYLNRLDDGRIILAHGKNAHHFLEITGLDTVKRFATTVTVAAEDVQRATTRLAQRAEAGQQSRPIPIIIDRTPVVVDGSLEEWKATATTDIASGAVRARIALRTDGRTLWASWRVTKNGGFHNTGDDRNRMFLSGDAVDLHLCSDPAPAQGRSEPGPGDCRIVLSRLGQAGVATFYRIKARGKAEAQSFSSPNRQVVFGQVEPVAGAKVAVAETSEGYIVEAALPVSALFEDPDALWEGRSIQGDAGVIVADSTSRRVLRLYRFNQAVNIVNDVPSEAVLMPAQWGTLRVAKP